MTDPSTTPSPRVIVVHDVLGTLFSLTEPIAVLQDLFKDQLGGDAGVAEKFAELIVMDWYQATQRDFTNLSLNGAYTPIASLFKANLPRALLQGGLVPPGTAPASLSSLRASAHTANPFALDGPVVTALMSSLQRLQPRPGMVEAFQRVYRDEIPGVQLVGATNGSHALANKLFTNALGEDARRNVTLWSCDDVQIAKPHPKVYEAIKKDIGINADAHAPPSPPASLWFVASHAWDTDAASRAGFKTCWMTYEEFDTAAYKKPDLYASDLEEAARKIAEYERQRASG